MRNLLLLALLILFIASNQVLGQSAGTLVDTNGRPVVVATKLDSVIPTPKRLDTLQRQISRTQVFRLPNLTKVYDYGSKAAGNPKLFSYKLARKGLNFSVLATYGNPADSNEYYVIQFAPLKPASDIILTEQQVDTVAVLNEKGEPVLNKDSTQKKTIVKKTVIKETLLGSPVFINSQDNDALFWVSKSDIKSLFQQKAPSLKFDNAGDRSFIIGANISVPVKVRPKVDGNDLRITPELSVGVYIGGRFRLSSRRPIYLVAPVGSVGLNTFVITNGNVANKMGYGNGAVIGVSASVGAMLQLSAIQIGVLVGRDRTISDFGSDWIYNNQPWYGISVGYSFFTGRFGKRETPN